MRTQKFNLSKRPLLIYDKVAYLVDYKNVELYRQYIEQYYDQKELVWFDDLILTKTCENKHQTFILYFGSKGFAYDYTSKNARAYTEHFTIHYVTKALIIVE